MPQAVLLFTGSLDSQLAARLLSEQRVEIDALFVRTPWNCGFHLPEQFAARLELPLTIVDVQADFCDPLTTIARRGAPPTHFCGDCHLYLARLAAQRRNAIGADFVATGDVLGQRAANQKRRDYDRFAHHSGLGDRLLWPLSAQRLPATWPEAQGWVDRSSLGNFCGRSRAGLKALAGRWGLEIADRGQHGCPLGQTGDFGLRVIEHLCHGGSRQQNAFDLLRMGHHECVDGATRVIVGRRQAENAALEQFWRAGDTGATLLVQPEGFVGPTALIVGPATPKALGLAISCLLRYAKRPANGVDTVRITTRRGQTRSFLAGSVSPAAEWLAQLS